MRLRVFHACPHAVGSCACIFSHVLEGVDSILNGEPTKPKGLSVGDATLGRRFGPFRTEHLPLVTWSPPRWPTTRTLCLRTVLLQCPERIGQTKLYSSFATRIFPEIVKRRNSGNQTKTHELGPRQSYVSHDANKCVRLNSWSSMQSMFTGSLYIIIDDMSQGMCMRYRFCRLVGADCQWPPTGVSH